MRAAVTSVWWGAPIEGAHPPTSPDDSVLGVGIDRFGAIGDLEVSHVFIGETLELTADLDCRPIRVRAASSDETVTWYRRIADFCRERGIPVPTPAECGWFAAASLYP